MLPLFVWRVSPCPLAGRRQILDEFLVDFPTVTKDGAVVVLELEKSLFGGQLG